MIRHCEIIFVATETVARLAGFDGRGLHREFPQTFRAWWPSQGAETLRGLRFSRVTITDGVRRYLLGREDRRLTREFDEAVDYAKYALVYHPMLWIEL
jgi:hypothetical protein